MKSFQIRILATDYEALRNSERAVPYPHFAGWLQPI